MQNKWQTNTKICRLEGVRIIFNACKRSLFFNNKNLLNTERMVLHFNDIDALSNKTKHVEMNLCVL